MCTLQLVAKGFTQKPGMDYKETYSWVAKFISIRIIKSIVAISIGCKNCFFKWRPIKEEIFIQHLDGYKAKGQENKFCKFKKMIIWS